MEEDTEVTPASSESWRLKLPLPAPLDTLPPTERVHLDLDTCDDLDAVTLPRGVPQRAPRPAPAPPDAIPVWAILLGGTLLFLAVTTTVALVF